MEQKVTARETRTVTTLARGAVLQYPQKKEKQGRSGRGNQVQLIVQWLPDKSIVVRQIQGQPGVQVGRARSEPARHKARPRHSCNIAQVRGSVF